jgi:hypothetical protein
VVTLAPIAPQAPAGGLPYVSPAWPGGLQLVTYQGAPASSGVNHLVAAVTGKSIYVLSYALLAAGTVTAQFQDTTGTPVKLSPAWPCSATLFISRSPIVGGYLFATSAGQGLDLNLGGATAVNVELQFVVF